MKFEGIISFIWWRNVWCFVPLRATQQIWLGTREWTIQQKLLLWSEKSSFLPQLRFQLFPEKKFNPNGVGGLIVPALFSECKFSLKGVRRSKISWLFLIHYELLYEKFFFHSYLGWSGRWGHNQPWADNIFPALFSILFLLICKIILYKFSCLCVVLQVCHFT